MLRPVLPRTLRRDPTRRGLFGGHENRNNAHLYTDPQMPGVMKAGTLRSLDGKRVGRFITMLGPLEAGRGRGESRFRVNLRDHGKRIWDPPIISGLFFEGLGKWYRPWVEVDYRRSIGAHGEAYSLTLDEEERLFRLICDLIPPGGHIMVKYSSHPLTARALIFGVPPAATPLGYLMYRGGCRWYKDWYFAEGFMEGEEKLQASKPLDESRMRSKTAQIRDELREYLRSERDPSQPEMESVCRDLARRILDRPDSSELDTHPRIEPTDMQKAQRPTRKAPSRSARSSTISRPSQIQLSRVWPPLA